MVVVVVKDSVPETAEISNLSFVWFERKRGRNTHWLVVEYAEGYEPSELLNDFVAEGWAVDRTLPSWQAFGGSWIVPVPEGTALYAVSVSVAGTDLFEGWTLMEKRTRMKQARAVLRGHGYVDVPVRALGMEDLP